VFGVNYKRSLTIIRRDMEKRVNGELVLGEKGIRTIFWGVELG
jgi:hypothetical protein